MPTKEKAAWENYLESHGSESLSEENKFLKHTVAHLRKELSQLRAPPLLSAEVIDIFDKDALIRLNNGNEFLVKVSPESEELSSGDGVLVEQKNLNVIRKFSSRKNFNVEKFVIIEKPTIKWDEVGGLQEQVEEIKEVVELPLVKPELFKKVGITPPKGVLLYGPPGTGKTILAKAVANSTDSTFIELVGSELVQKFIGEGAKLVKEVFELAREKAPSILFIDEIDALAARRIDIGTSGEREVQRTFMQFLAELDGFKALGNVKVIGCTNRKDMLDPAILRPGRLDRLIFVDNPSIEGVKEIFKIHTEEMNFGKLDFDALYEKLLGLSGAEIKSVCTEAGYFAIRSNRSVVTEKDLLMAIEKVKDEETDEDHKRLIG
jgi:proteasome regulatory subunit